MPRTFIEIGPAPTEEACAQVGTDNYPRESAIQCKVFRRMLNRLFPLPEAVDAVVSVKSFPHDFGTYREVVCYYDPENTAEADYAYRLERETPERWDSIAVWELVWFSQRQAFVNSVSAGKLPSVPAFYAGDEPPPLDANDHDALMRAITMESQARTSMMLHMPVQQADCGWTLRPVSL